jgi:hypothetical protein
MTPEVQKVFQFRMLKGRFFNDGDTATSLPVVVVNREFIREYEGVGSDPGKFLETAASRMLFVVVTAACCCGLRLLSRLRAASYR